MLQIFARLKASIGLVLVITLFTATGGHWFVLQSLAWVRMSINYSRQDGLSGGIQKTFDGKHPCKLCHRIEKQRQKPATDPARTLAEMKVEPFLLAGSADLGPDSSHVKYAAAGKPASSATFSPPPTPPPELGRSVS